VRIFLASGSYDVAYGGPAFSVSRLGLALAKKGIEVFLWAPDESAVSSRVIADHRLLHRCRGPLREAIRRALPDLVHDNGIWMPHNHRLAKVCNNEKMPRVVSVRGMLEPWAINHKRFRKVLAWWLYQRNDLRSVLMLHVTAPMEKKHLEKYRLGVSIEIIPNGIDIPAIKKHNQERVGVGLGDNHRIALFMSRLNPKKGLPMLIEAWGRVKPKGWRLIIAGPDEGGHQREVERMVRDKGLAQEVSFLGPVDPESRSRLYWSAELFILPTHSENFGMVIGEALAHGVPVLTTKGAPWPLLEKERCGWWVDPSVEGVEKGLRSATSLSRRDLSDMGGLGHKFIRRDYSWEKIADRFIKVYREILST